MTAADIRETSEEIGPPPQRRRFKAKPGRATAPAVAARFDAGKSGEARKRSPVWLAGGLLLVLACALGGALLFSSTDDRVSVLVAARDLPPGVPVDRSSFVVQEVAAGSAVASVAPRAIDSIVGRLPAGPIPKGTMISDGLLVESVALEADEMVVGVALDPGEAPTESIDVGVPVELLVVSSPAAAADGSKASRAESIGVGTVWRSQQLSSGQVLLSVRVDRPVGLAAAAASTDDRLRVALVGAGG